MKKYIVGLFLLFGLGSISAQSLKKEVYNIIPLPRNIEMGAGNPFVLTASTTISFPKKDENLKQIAAFLSEYIQISTGIKLQVTDSPISKNNIELQSNFKNENKEAYKFDVTQNKIIINGSTSAGTFYGVQLLRKVLMNTTQKTPIELPNASIVARTIISTEMRSATSV